MVDLLEDLRVDLLEDHREDLLLLKFKLLVHQRWDQDFSCTSSELLLLQSQEV